MFVLCARTLTHLTFGAGALKLYPDEGRGTFWLLIQELHLMGINGETEAASLAVLLGDRGFQHAWLLGSSWSSACWNL